MERRGSQERCTLCLLLLSQCWSSRGSLASPVLTVLIVFLCSGVISGSYLQRPESFSEALFRDDPRGSHFAAQMQPGAAGGRA